MLVDLQSITQKYITPLNNTSYERGLMGVYTTRRNKDYYNGLYKGKHFNILANCIKNDSIYAKNLLMSFDVAFCKIEPVHEKFIEFIAKYMTYDDCVYYLYDSFLESSRIKIILAHRIIDIEIARLYNLKIDIKKPILE